MVRIALSLLLVFPAFAAQSQKKDSTLSQKISAEFCVEFSKKDFTTYKDSEMEIGMIMLPLIKKYEKEIAKEWGYSSSNLEDYEKIGEKIGQEAALGCPKFLEFVKNNLAEILPGDEIATKSLDGEVVAVEDQVFSCVVVKTKANKEEKLWWFNHFDGADAIIKNKDSLLRKSVSVEYNEMEVYDPRLKEYRTIKVIQKITTI